MARDEMFTTGFALGSGEPLRELTVGDLLGSLLSMRVPLDTVIVVAAREHDGTVGHTGVDSFVGYDGDALLTLRPLREIE